jgi:hypothetical protein
LYFYRTRIVCHWIIYGYAPMIRSFVYRAFVRLRFPYSSFVSCIVRFSYRSFVFRPFAFGAYCKLIRSRICSSVLWCPLRKKTDVQIAFALISFVGDWCLICILWLCAHSGVQLTSRITSWLSYRRQELLTLREHMVHLRFLRGSV